MRVLSVSTMDMVVTVRAGAAVTTKMQTISMQRWWPAWRARRKARSCDDVTDSVGDGSVACDVRLYVGSSRDRAWRRMYVEQ